MIELLKYFSPIAIIGLIWGIFQYFDKKKIEKREKRRNEKLEYYLLLKSKLNELRHILIEPHTLIKKYTRLLNSNLSVYESRTNDDIEKLEVINKQIDNYDFQNRSKEELLIDQNMLIKILNERRKDSGRFLKKEVENLKTQFPAVAQKLEQKIKELNEIPILGQQEINESIINLTMLINDLINIITTNETHSDEGELSNEFTDLLIDSVDEIYDIEKLIEVDLK